jgi:NAD(P)-dependent dehydrogenase (short-subunit alcohol dehydrogenase family)
MKPPRPLAGLHVAVTGGAHGIGRAIAGAFTAAGAEVAIGDLDATGAQAAADEVGGLGLALDVTDPNSFRAFLDAAEARHGPLDVLVNNAGIDWIGPFDQEPYAVTRRELEVNLLGPIIGSRLALQRWLADDRPGHLINIASGAGRIPLPGSASYSASKHGVVGLTESLRLEYRHTGIRFSVVQPAQVETAMMDGQARSRLLTVVTPADVATAVLNAVRYNRFEVWVPASQGIAAKLGAVLPRRLREAALLAIGIGRLAQGADRGARRGYHERMFPGPE